MIRLDQFLDCNRFNCALYIFRYRNSDSGHYVGVLGSLCVDGKLLMCVLMRSLELATAIVQWLLSTREKKKWRWWNLFLCWFFHIFVIENYVYMCLIIPKATIDILKFIYPKDILISQLFVNSYICLKIRSLL